MHLAACYCRFKREQDSDWEEGIAITTEHGMSSFVCVIPHDATSKVDALEELWDYQLDWTASLYPRK